MKKRVISSMVIFAFLFGVMGVSKAESSITSDQKICAFNIVGQGVGTLVKGLIQGKVKSLKSAAKMLFWGSMSGYGFYQSKKMIGNGSVTSGIILANIAASVTENTARGDNPFSYLGYSIGPARIEIATPFAGNDKALFNIQVSPSEIIRFALAMQSSDRIRFRNGLIAFEADDYYRDNARGWAHGMYPTTVVGVPDHVFLHESIHVVQYIQSMSVSPQLLNRRYNEKIEGKKLINFSYMNFNYVSILTGIDMNENDPRFTNWNEIEAYALAPEASTN